MATKPNKTHQTSSPVEDFLDRLSPETRRQDALTLAQMMARLSGEPAKLWGPSIVGFGVRRYRYESGREGEILRIGFSPRKAAFALYITQAAAEEPLLKSLGKITTGKSCVYVKTLDDIDLDVLETLIGIALAKN